MAKQVRLSKEQLERILSSRLMLKDPKFLIERAGSRLVGDIVSPTFKGKRDHERQKMIWDALDNELGAEAGGQHRPTSARPVADGRELGLTYLLTS
jgi:stress-induced morphogen